MVLRYYWSVDVLPMKAPTLPIRLNKQLSGGYEPHLLWQTEKMSKNEVSSRVTLWADKRSAGR